LEPVVFFFWFVCSQFFEFFFFFQRLGTTNPNIHCSTCGQATEFCAGHVMTIDLPLPCFSGIFLNVLSKLLSCVCYKCSALLLPWTHHKVTQAMSSKAGYKKTINSLFGIAHRYRVCAPDGVEADIPIDEAIQLGYCGSKQPQYWTRHENVLVRPVFEGEQVPTVTPHDVYAILMNVPDEVTRLFGFEPKNSPLRALMTCKQTVPPILMRPSRSMYSEDDLTTRLRRIMTYVASYTGNQSNNLSMCIRDGKAAELDSEVQYDAETQPSHTRCKKPVVPRCLTEYFDIVRHVVGFVDSRQNTQYTYDYGRHKLSVRDRFCTSKIKSARMRGSVFGKRSDFSARSVTTPNTYILPNEVGLPISMCMTLTVDETVSRYNYAKMMRLVQRGPVYPGANFIVRKNSTWRLPGFCHEGLQLGDVVKRHLVKGDMVLINRQPTLHRFGLMAFYVVPVLESTIQIHLSVTTPFNADFDGDEINIFSLLDTMAVSEAREILEVSKNMWKDGQLMVAFVQHAVLAMYMLTLPEVVFTYAQVVQLLWSGNDASIFSELVAGLSCEPVTGVQLAQMLLPSLVRFPVNKSSVNRALGDMIKRVWRDTGVNRIGFIVRVLQEYLITRGGTMGLDDCTLRSSEEAEERSVAAEQRRYLRNIDMLLEEKSAMTYPPAITSIENNVLQLGDNVRSIMGNFYTAKLQSRHDSWLYGFVTSGAKGNVTHLVQNTACVGQQLNASSQRLPKLLGYYAETRAESEGMVLSSFVDGLNNVEFFHHSRSSRLGLVGTAITVSEGGYAYRCISKSMEDLRTMFDTTVRDADGNMVVSYPGFDTSHLELVEIRLVSMTADQVRATYDTGYPSEVEHLLVLRERVLSAKLVQTAVHVPIELDKLQWVVERNRRGVSQPVRKEDMREAVASMWVRLVTEFYVPSSTLVEAVFFDYLSSASLLTFVRTRDDLVFLVKYVCRRMCDGVIPCSTGIGLVSAQSFSEPLTQLQLNFFHVGGQKTMLKGGIAHVKEILHLVKNTSTPSMKICLKADVEFDASAELLQLRMCDIVQGWYDEAVTSNSFRIVFQLDKTSLLQRRIPPRVLSTYISGTNFFRSETNVTFSHADLHDEVWSFTLCKTHVVGNVHASMVRLAHFVQSNKDVIRGTKDIVAFYEEEKVVHVLRDNKLVPEKRRVIVTLGSNLQDVCQIPAADLTYTRTNCILEVYKCLGVDAAAHAIQENLCEIMSNNSASVANQHLKMIARTMTYSGVPCGFNFSGMSNANVNNLKLASFERTFDGFLKGAVSGHKDSLQGISESVLCGNRIPIGTGGNIKLLQHHSAPVVQPPVIRLNFSTPPDTSVLQSRTPLEPVFYNYRKRAATHQVHKKKKKKHKKHKASYDDVFTISSP
jgi:DNA-directed RNA polymerase II subunit RPB1